MNKVSNQVIKLQRQHFVCVRLAQTVLVSSPDVELMLTITPPFPPFVLLICSAARYVPRITPSLKNKQKTILLLYPKCVKWGGGGNVISKGGGGCWSIKTKSGGLCEK